MSGSVWNQNAFHWETRDYTPFGTELLKAALLAVTATHGPLAVKVTDVPTLALECAVNIRRGKKFVIWEISKLSIDWKGYAPSGAVDRVTTGKVALEAGGIMHDDASSDFPLKLSHTGTTAYDSACRDIAHKQLLPLVRQAIRAWAKAIEAHDDRLDTQAVALREEEKAKALAAAPAASTAVVEKDSGLASNPDADKALVASVSSMLISGDSGSAAANETNTSAKPTVNSSSSGESSSAAVKAPVVIQTVPAAPTNTNASVWNAGAFLWEERSLTSWAKAR